MAELEVTGVFGRVERRGTTTYNLDPDVRLPLDGSDSEGTTGEKSLDPNDSARYAAWLRGSGGRSFEIDAGEEVLSRNNLGAKPTLESESADHQWLGSKRVWPGSSKLGITSPTASVCDNATRYP